MKEYCAKQYFLIVCNTALFLLLHHSLPVPSHPGGGFWVAGGADRVEFSAASVASNYEALRGNARRENHIYMHAFSCTLRARVCTCMHLHMDVHMCICA